MQTRVLPFATAFAARGPLPPPLTTTQQQEKHQPRAMYMAAGQASRRFAVARPRRVVTDNGGAKVTGTRPQRPHGGGGRRHSAAIGLVPAGGARTRAIIGLGLTLNPADAVVKLQPRHATQTAQTGTRSVGSIKQRAAVHRSPEAIAEPEKEAKEEEEKEGRGLSPGLSLFASPQPSLVASSEESQSPRTSDPQLVAVHSIRQQAVVDKAEDMAVIDGWMATPSPPQSSSMQSASADEFSSCMASPSPSPSAVPRVPQTPRTSVATEITCLLCFERVLAAASRTRGHAMRCPSCLGILSEWSSTRGLKMMVQAPARRLLSE
ncbi:hypothetical protein IWW47_000046 [Coemansia sp. RSA 2052]|nr:hypothetical protein IWW47_000046 [Coemansia sp. RSA 2052]